MTELDAEVHQPTRLRILMLLSGVATADFNFLLNTLGLTKGNLSVHLSKLEQAGFVNIEKTYRGKVPLTLCRLTEAGRTAFEDYRKQLIRFVENSKEK